jgi:LPS sulfotransferase NodH
VEEYFPSKEEIIKFDKVIFLTRIDNFDAAISHITARDSEEWHKEYEVTSEWIEENKIRIIDISNYIASLKMRIKDYIGFHITYEDLYVNKSSVPRILDYINIDQPKYLEMLDYDKRYRKDDNGFTKDNPLRLI